MWQIGSARVMTQKMVDLKQFDLYTAFTIKHCTFDLKERSRALVFTLHWFETGGKDSTKASIKS